MQTLYNNVLRPTQERLKHTQNLVGWLHYITGLLVFFLLLAFQNAAAQKPSENDVFYYYPPTGKIELQTSTEKVLVKFKSEKNLSQVQSILSKEAQIAPPKDQMYFASLGVYVLDLQNIGQVSEVKSLVGNLNANPEIDFAYPFVRWQQGKVLQAPYNQILLGLKQVSDLPLLTDQLAKLNLQIVKQNAFNPKLYHLALTETSSGDVYDMANRLYETGLFAFAEPDFVKLNMIENLPTPALTPPPSPTDPLYNTQWALNNTGSNSTPAGTADADMDVPEAWPTTTGSSTIKIAIIDTGVDLVHPDLVGNLLAGFDATGQGTNGGPLGTGTNAHGTSCAGQVAAIGNSIGVIGIAYTSKIIPVRVFHNLSTTDSWLADGINWAWNNAGADVLSNSWGGGPPSSVIDAAIDGAVTSGRAGKGSVVLFSSGNDNSSVSYPASNSKVIAVGAMSMCDERKNPASCDGENWWGGNYGTNLDVSAPGVKIQTTDISGANGFESGDYIPDFNGTSSACPNAAGVMALILSVNPNLTQLQARSILEGTCDKTGGYTYNQNVAGQPHGSWSNDLGHGRVNAARAVAAAATPDDVDMDGYTVAQGDCNDFDASIHPNATEICDFLDNDCDGQTDEGFTIVTCYRDSDMDNFGNPAVSKQFCATCGAGYVLNNTDCNDNNNTVYPNALEICDLIDNDCNGSIDEGFDVDMDGYTVCAGDCNDNNPNVNPGKTEICNGIDDNCDGVVDFPALTTYASTDVPKAISNLGTSTVTSTLTISGVTGNILDLNVKDLKILHTWIGDLKATLTAPDGTIFTLFDQPGVPTSSGGCNQNHILATFDDAAILTAANFESTCNLSTSPVANPTTYAISGTYQPLNSLAPLIGTSPNGTWTLTVSDVFSGDGGSLTGWSLEIGLPSPTTTYYVDADGDTYGDPNNSIALSCTPTSGFVLNNADCNDQNAAIYPGSSYMHPVDIVPPTTCGGSDGSISLSGFAPNTLYSVSYTKGMTTVPAANFTSNGTGAIIIPNLSAGNYTNIVAASGTCSSNPASATLNDPVPPTASVGGNNGPICAGSNATFTVTGTSGATLTYTLTGLMGNQTLLLDGTNQTISANNAMANVTLTLVSVTKNNCNVTLMENSTVTVLNPAASVATGATICVGGSTTLTATGCVGSGLVLKWYKTSDNVEVTMPVSPMVNTQYYAKCEQTLNNVTCVSPTSANVTVVVLNPAAPVVTGSATICSGGSTTLTATGCVGSGLVLKWYKTADNLEVMMPVSPTVNTQYYAKCEQTLNTVTCVSAASGNVTVTVLNPAAPVATGGATICAGSSTTLTATGCVGSGLVLKWYKTSDNVEVMMPVSPMVNTQYYAKCEQTLNNVTCVSAASGNVTVTVNAQPVSPTLNAKTPNLSAVCTGTGVSATFTAGSGGVGCSDDYTLSIDGGMPVAYTPGSTVGTTATSSIVIQGRRANCSPQAACTGTNYVTLASWNVSPQPVSPTLNAKTPNIPTICAGTAVIATFNLGSGGVGCSDDYVVIIDNGSPVAYSQGTLVGSNATSSIVIQGRRANCSAGSGCTGTDYVTLASWNVVPQPVGPTLNTKTPNLSAVCVGTGVSATFNSGSGGVGCSDDYVLIIDAGTPVAYTPGSTVGSNATTSIEIRGRRANCSAQTGCNGTAYVTLASWSVNPQPVGPTLLAKTPNVSAICFGTGVSATFNAGSGGVGCLDNFTLSIDGGTPLAYTPGSTVGANANSSIVIQGRRAGCSAGAGCNGTTYVTLASWSVSPQPVGPSLLAKTPMSAICFGTGVSATFNAGSGGVGCSDDYTVSIDGGSAVAYTPGSTVGTTAVSSIVIQGRRANCTASSGCNGTSYVTLASWSVNPLPTASISSSTALCQNAPFPNVTFTGNGGTKPYVFTYQINTGGNLTVSTTGVSNSVSVAQTTAVAGVFNYSLVSVKDGNGCEQLQSGSATITVHAPPVVSTPQNSLCTGLSMTLSPTSGGIWQSSNASIASVTPQGFVTAITAGAVYFTFTQSSTGCAASTSNVTIKPTPTSNLTASKVDVCANTEVTLNPNCSIPTSTVNWNPGGPTVTPAAATLPYVYRARCVADGCVGNESSVEVRTHRILVDMKDLDVGALPLPIVRPVIDNMKPTNQVNAPVFPRRWTFIANGCDASESAEFKLSGPVLFNAIDNTSTYAMFANEGNSFYSIDHFNYGNGGSFPDGTYSLTVNLRSKDGVGGPYPKNRVPVGALLATRTLEFTVGNPVGLRQGVESIGAELSEANWVMVVQNPVSEEIMVRLSGKVGEEVGLSLVNLQGQSIQQRSVKLSTVDQAEVLNIRNAPSGLYILKAIKGDKVKTIKVVKVD